MVVGVKYVGQLVENWAHLSLQRLALFRTHIEEVHLSRDGELFSKQFFETKYVPLLKAQRQQIENEYLNSYRSLDGHKLLSKRQISVHLIEDDYTFNAFISPRPNSISTDISISSGAFFCLDVMAAMVVAIEFGFFPSPASKPDLMGFGREIMDTTSAMAGLSALVELYKLTQFHDTASEHRWAVAASYSLYWLLSHEVGHYACGHIGYLQYRDTLEYDAPVAGYFSESLNHARFIEDVELNDAMILWCAEFMADSYATIRLLLEVTHDDRASGEFKAYPTQLRAFGLASTATRVLSYCFVPAMVMHGERISGTSSAFNKYGTHPSTLSRLFNISATVDYFMRPVGNTANDLRENPAREYVTPTKDREACWSMLFQSYWKSHKSVLHFLEMCYYADSSDGSNIEPTDSSTMQLTTLWMSNVFIARQGITELNLNNVGSSQIKNAFARWANSLRLLSTNVNLRFSHYIPKNWIGPSGLTQGLRINPEHAEALDVRTEKQAKSLLDAQNKLGHFVSDPAYKILDDWMSNIYHCAENMTSDERRPYVDQEINLATLVGARIRP